MRERYSYFTALVIVVLAGLVTALLFVTALVLWLAELMGSVIYPCLIVGLFFALLAFVVYRVSLRDIVRDIYERMDTIYAVTKTLRDGVEWAMRLLFRAPAE